jgi:hypothetical protein
VHEAVAQRTTREPPPVHPAGASAGGCPGSRPRVLQAPEAAPPSGRRPAFAVVADAPPPLVPQGGSRLGQWPVQLHLVSPNAPYLKGADLLIAADCVPFAYARFHEDLLDGKRVLVGCPKLDDLAAYAEKLTQIFRAAVPRTVTVVKMEVPCCGGIAVVARQALAASGVSAPIEVLTVGIAGAIVRRE